MSIPYQSQAEAVLAVIGAGYIIHKVYAVVEYGTAKVKAVAAALKAPVTTTAPAATAAKATTTK